MTAEHPTPGLAEDAHLPGFDYAWRPSSYGPAFDLRTRVMTTVKGQARRAAALGLIDAGDLEAIGGCLISPSLSEEDRDALGRLHPMLMGGEYLPDIEPHQVEIARVSLRSVTGDVISVRARHEEGRIIYEVCDEYETEFHCEPEASDTPLSLGELIHLMEHALDEGGLVIGFLDMNYENGSTLDSLIRFAKVSSAFYPELGGYYEARCRAWCDARQAEWDAYLEEDDDD